MVQVLGYTLSRLAADTLPPGRAVELPGRGTTFVYEQPGPPNARTVMLIHGLAASGALNWFPSFGPLSERYHVVAVDLRGHGHGIPARGNYRLADCADDVIALADHLGVDRFIPVGYSLGGPVAQLMWHRHRERVEGMVLCATSRNFGGTTRRALVLRQLVGRDVRPPGDCGTCRRSAGAPARSRRSTRPISTAPACRGGRWPSCGAARPAPCWRR